MDYQKKIEELRRYFNTSNAGLERLLGLSNGYLLNIEKSKIDNPSKLLIALAANNVSTDWFLSDLGPMISIPITKEMEKLAELAIEDFNSPAAKFLRDYVEKNPELIRVQVEEAERALKTYNLLLNNEPKNRLIESSPISPEKPKIRLIESSPISPEKPKIRLNPRTPSGVPLVYEEAEGIDDGIAIPLLENAASAGYGAGLDGSDTPARYVRVPQHLSKYLHLASLPVKGDSMEPTLSDGDLVVCDGGGWDGDGIYVLKTHDTAYVKRVQMTSQGYEVISDNKMYKSITESVESLSIVGKVRAILVIVPGRRGGI